MRKSKKLVLAMLMAGSLTALTACAKMEDPTTDDVMEALIDEKMIEEDDEDKYTITIDKVSIDEEDEEAKVTCSVVSKEGSLEVTKEYKVRFKYRDDKSWKSKEVELKDTEKKLVEGIDDETASDLIENLYVTADEMNVNLSNENSTFEVDKHENDLENKKDKVIYKCTATSGYYDLTFDLEVTFGYEEYSDSWYRSDYKVDNVEKEYAENYTIDLKEADVAKALADEKVRFTALSEYYNFSGDGVKISDFAAGEATIDEYSAKVPATFTYTYNDVVVKLSVDMKYSYNTEKGWQFSYLDSYEVVDFDCGLTGTYSGLSGTDTVTITIADTYNVEKKGMDAQISVTTAEGVSYSYVAYLRSYKPSDDNYFSLADGDWISQPATGYYYTASYSGKVKNGNLTSDSTWNPWTFTKQQ